MLWMNVGEMRWMHSALMWSTRGSKSAPQSLTSPGQASSTSRDPTSGWQLPPSRMWMPRSSLSSWRRWWRSCSHTSARWQKTTLRTTSCSSMNCSMVSWSCVYIVHLVLYCNNILAVFEALCLHTMCSLRSLWIFQTVCSRGDNTSVWQRFEAILYDVR